MKAFTAQGIWWLPESPENRLPGSLSCSETGELRLTLLGHSLSAWASGARRCPILLGEIRQEERSRAVTLTDCIVSRSTLASGLAGNTEEIFAHRGYFGTHLPDELEHDFSAASVAFSGLSSWAGDFTGFSRSDRMFSATWNSPEPVVCPVPGGTVTFGIGCSSRNTTRERRLTESAGFTLRFRPPQRASAIGTDFVHPLQNFLTFATDTPNAIVDYDLTPSHTDEQVEVIGATTFSDEAVAAELRDERMLLTYRDVAGRLPEVIRRWLELSKIQAAAFSIHFGSVYRPPGYTDIRFMQLMHALSLYTAASRVPSSTPHASTAGTVAGSNRDAELLECHPLVTGQHAVTTMSAAYEDLFTPLLGLSGRQRREEFIEYVLTTHRYTITRQPQASRYARGGSDLLWLCERLGLLLKIAILKELGLAHTDLQSLLNRNRTYAHLRDSLVFGDAWLEQS